MIQDHIAACSGGTTFLVTKYIPPAVGYAETSSATAIVTSRRAKWETHIPEADMHDAIKDPTSHARIVAAGPPKLRGIPNVAGTEPKIPSTETAYERVDHLVK